MNRKWSLLPFLLMPMIAFAEDSSASLIAMAFIWELFSSLHVSFILLLPLKDYFALRGYTKVKFWHLFLLRAVLLILITPKFPYIFIVDFFSMFVGMFFLSFRNKKAFEGVSNMDDEKIESQKGLLVCPKCNKECAYGNSTCPQCGTSLEEAKYVCPKCHKENVIDSKFCKECGEVLIGPFEKEKTPEGVVKCPKCQNELSQPMNFCRYCGENVEKITGGIPLSASVGTPFVASPLESKLMHSNESSYIRALIKEELLKDPSWKTKTIPSLEKKKMLFTIMYVIIIFIITTIYVAFHTYQLLDVFLVVVITGVFLWILRKYNLTKYIEKEVLKRPDEKISYVTSSIMSGAASGKYLSLFVQIGLVALLIFGTGFLYKDPHMIFERQNNGYHLRYYTYGLFSSETEIKIPKKYKGEPVVGIRGDTFKNVSTVEKIVLPSSIKEIRGGAFKNCTNLKDITLPEGLTEIHGGAFAGCSSLETINIPKSVTRIGGEAFKNCISLKTISIPDTVLEISGEAFYNCMNLEGIELPPYITEVHGSTFENCSKLEKVVIPEEVTRIGGSAFRNCYRLAEVTIPESVTEIGSSAFRNTAIKVACISRSASVNERAFKETSATIVYYDENCEIRNSGGKYDNVFNNYDTDWIKDLEN